MKDADQLLAELKQKRDELKVQIHLGSAEAKDEWAKLEQKWEKFAAEAKLDTSGEGIGESIDSLGDELKNAYERIRKAI